MTRVLAGAGIDMNTLIFSESVYHQICETIGKLPPECGGVLGAVQNDFITEFFFDAKGNSSVNGYAPDIQSINDMLINDWMPRGVLMVGIVHSHSNGIAVPSCGDISYGIRILQALDIVDRFYLPIVTTSEDNQLILTCFGIFLDAEKGYVCRKIPHEIRRKNNDEELFADPR